MSLKIDTADEILLDGQRTGLGVTQRRDGTVVYTRERPGVRYAEHKMPHARYLLGSDSQITKPGVATRAQFESDVRALLERLA